jgi:threonylcarbamoyladenosine tRNA methylthiotransferase MtaB
MSPGGRLEAPSSAGDPARGHRPATARGPRVAFHTFGCKLNQCETAGIRSRFHGAGFAAVSFDAPADVYVVNTCSVTGRADAQARQLLRRTIRERAGARIVVTGCYAQRAPQELARIPGVHLVAGNGEKESLVELVSELLEEGAPALEPGPALYPGDFAAPRLVVSDLRKSRRPFDLDPVEFGERTRAYLRVQDGCDAGCTFCIIPRIRGRSTSLPADLVVERVRHLVASGYRELVLTGIHLGHYGLDRPGGETLAALVGRLEALPGQFRLRLSSIEPQEIDAPIIERMAAGGRLVPHLHVPLQSGSDRILAAMNRTYTSGEYDDIVNRLAARIDPIGLGADVIVGFPGETDADFEATLRFIADRPFTYLHVFPYSPRPGTRAASLPGRPPGPVVDERSRRLRELSDAKRAAFAARFVGREVRVLVEEPAEGDAWAGWSEHYVRTAFDWPTGEDLTNRVVAVTGREAREGRLAGAPAAPPGAEASSGTGNRPDAGNSVDLPGALG